jgi:hypothetical protein
MTILIGPCTILSLNIAASLKFAFYLWFHLNLFSIYGFCFG